MKTIVNGSTFARRTAKRLGAADAQSNSNPEELPLLDLESMPESFELLTAASVSEADRSKPLFTGDGKTKTTTARGPHTPRRSRAAEPGLAEQLLPEATPPISALPGGAAGAPTEQTERRRDRRIGESAFTRSADVVSVLFAPLAAGYVSRSVGLFVAAAGLTALARSRARSMALGERATSTITLLVAILAVVAVSATDALVTADATLSHTLRAGLAALIVAAAAAIGTEVFSRALVRTRVAVIGSAAAAHELSWDLQRDRNRRYEILGFISPPGHQGSGDGLRHVSFGVRPLGDLSDLDAIVDANDVDMLVLAQGSDRLEVFDRAAGCAERRRTRLVGLGTFNESVFQRVSIDELNSAWLQHMMHPHYRPAPAALIRLLDIAGALLLAVLTLPLWVASAIAVRAGDGGPVLYRQRRVGERGRIFTIIKFRSMRTDAEAAGPRWSNDDDDRVTRVGRIIRRFHVDELPQLINVLRGDMSLVGPRPERPEFVQRLEADIPFYSRRHLIKPGVTGWAQVRAGYGMTDDGQAVKLSRDLFYLKQHSVLLYLYVLAGTVFTVIAGTVHSRAH